MTSTVPVSSATTLVPPQGLVVPNPQANGEALFCLFTEDWLTLQAFITQALTLPITVGEFTAKYGAFSDEQEIENCIKAMQAVQGLSAKFGDPQSLIKQLASDPAILQTTTAPAQLYTHIVWFANQLYQAATTFNQTLGQFLQLLNPANCGSKEQCGAVLKEVLTGTGGLQSTADQMTGLADALVQAFAQFTTQLSPSVTTMTDYTADSSTFLQAVESDITTDITNINTYQAAASSAYDNWRNYTISATTTSVGVLILSGGVLWPVSAALGGSLGASAAKARTAYNNACTSLAQAQADQQQKIQLKLDLEGLNKQMTPTDAAAQNFLSTLQKVAGVWSGISNNIAYIANTYTPAELGDLSWVMQAMRLDDATMDWQTIAAAAQAYTSNSLVSAQIHPFGTPLAAA